MDVTDSAPQPKVRSFMRRAIDDAMKEVASEHAGGEERSLLDWFAGQALGGLYAAGQSGGVTACASFVYDQAQAMLDERAKRMES